MLVESNLEHEGEDIKRSAADIDSELSCSRSTTGKFNSHEWRTEKSFLKSLTLREAARRSSSREVAARNFNITKCK